MFSPDLEKIFLKQGGDGSMSRWSIPGFPVEDVSVRRVALRRCCVDVSFFHGGSVPVFHMKHRLLLLFGGGFEESGGYAVRVRLS